MGNRLGHPRRENWRAAGHASGVRFEVLPTARRPLVGLGVIAAGLALAFALVYYVTVRTVVGRQLGDASLRGALSADPLLSDTLRPVLDVVSVASLLGAVALVAVIALLRLARLEGLAAIGLLVGSNASTWLLKNVLLERPDLGLAEVAPATLNSLPSGHSTAAFSAVAALVFVVPRRWRRPTGSIGAGYATLTALTTMIAGWHRPADAVAAFLLVGVWTAAAAAVVILGTRPTPGEPPAPTSPSARWLVALAAGTLTFGFVTALAVVGASPAQGTALGSAAAFFAGGLFIVGTASGVTAGLLKVVEIMESATVGRSPRASRA